MMNKLPSIVKMHIDEQSTTVIMNLIRFSILTVSNVELFFDMSCILLLSAEFDRYVDRVDGKNFCRLTLELDKFDDDWAYANGVSKDKMMEMDRENDENLEQKFGWNIEDDTRLKINSNIDSEKKSYEHLFKVKKKRKETVVFLFVQPGIV